MFGSQPKSQDQAKLDEARQKHHDLQEKFEEQVKLNQELKSQLEQFDPQQLEDYANAASYIQSELAEIFPDVWKRSQNSFDLLQELVKHTRSQVQYATGSDPLQSYKNEILKLEKDRETLQAASDDFQKKLAVQAQKIKQELAEPKIQQQPEEKPKSPVKEKQSPPARSRVVKESPKIEHVDLQKPIPEKRRSPPPTQKKRSPQNLHQPQVQEEEEESDTEAEAAAIVQAKLKHQQKRERQEHRQLAKELDAKLQQLHEINSSLSEEAEHLERANSQQRALLKRQADEIAQFKEQTAALKKSVPALKLQIFQERFLVNSVLPNNLLAFTERGRRDLIA